MDTLLLTCHFLFGQKQLSLQTPRSRGLWVLLTGSDLFTQPRDKVSLAAHPGATSPLSLHMPPYPPSHQIPRTRWCCWQRLEPLSTLRQRCVWIPHAQGISPGLIRSSMMKWAERPQTPTAPSSNHSSLNWQSASHCPIGVKSWITFLFLSLSNYPHPLTCSLSHSDHVWLAFSLCYNAPYPHQPQLPPSLPLCLPRLVLALLLLLTDHNVLLRSLKHQSLTPTTCSCQSTFISHFLYLCVYLPYCF